MTEHYDAAETGNPTEVSRIADELFMDFSPDAIIVVGSTEAQQLIGALETATVSSLAEDDKPLWVVSEAIRTNDLLTENSLAGAYDRIIGTVFSASGTLAYAKFQTAYDSIEGSDFRAVDFPFADKAWDAAFLIALGYASQSDPSATTGTQISEVIRRTAGGSIMFDADASGFTGAANALSGGGTIDFVGASGDLDFDASGDVSSSVAWWQIDDTGASPVFQDQPSIDVSGAQ